jgi:hypothetical protein
MAAAAGTSCDALILGSETVDPFEYTVRWNIPPVGCCGRPSPVGSAITERRGSAQSQTVR